jgi:hypothetical protein
MPSENGLAAHVEELSYVAGSEKALAHHCAPVSSRWVLQEWRDAQVDSEPSVGLLCLGF